MAYQDLAPTNPSSNYTPEFQAQLAKQAAINTITPAGNGYYQGGNFFETDSQGNPIGNNPNAPKGNAAKEADVIAGKAYKDANGNIIYGDKQNTVTTMPVTTMPVTTMSSDAAAGDHKDLGNTINTEADLIRQEQDSLKQILDANIAEIKAQGEIQDRQLAQTQTEENATNQAVQFKLGRAGTDYASSATQKLNQLHLDQQAQMTSQRQALISQSNAAYRAGNIALAKELVQNAKDVAKQQAEAKKAQAEQISRDLQDKINKQTLMTKTMDNLATSNIPLTSITQDAKTAYETEFGIPAGSFDALYTATQQAQKVKSAEDLAKLATTIAKLAETVPEGTTQEIKLPDGSTYTVVGTKSEHSPIYKEWQDYKNTGGKLDFNAYQTMDANRKAPRITIDQGEKLMDKINADASALIEAMNKKSLGWGGAFDTLKAKYPNLTNESVNQLLNGSIEYDPKTGIFGAATGNAAKEF